MLILPGRIGLLGSTALRLVPPAGAAYAVNRIIIDGDSISSTTENQAGFHGDFYSYTWGDTSGKTVSVMAQASRTVGGAQVGAELADGGTPAGNTLFAHIADQNAFNPDLHHVMIGMNDMQTFSVNAYRSRLITWANSIRTSSRKIMYSPPTPMRVAAPQNANYAVYTGRRTTHMADVRDPAVWGQWADYYSPLGEIPDFNTNSAVLINSGPGDGIHPTGPATTGGTGQALLLASFTQIMASIIDQSRASSTAMYNAAWPANETNLTVSTLITRRIIVSGIAHTGLALGASISGGSATISLNGGTPRTVVGTTSGNGYRIYNGDIIDIALTTSASNNTPVSFDLTIGSETRTITYTTVAAVSPIAVSSAGTFIDPTPTTAKSSHTFTATFDTGLAVLAINSYSSAGGAVDSGPTSITVNGVTATKVGEQTRSTAASRVAEIWTCPVTAGPGQPVVINRAATATGTVVQYMTLLNADPTAQSFAGNTPAETSTALHATPAATVPANGISVAAYLIEDTATPTAVTLSGTGTMVNTGVAAISGATTGIALATRADTGTTTFSHKTGTYARLIATFKAAGT